MGETLTASGPEAPRPPTGGQTQGQTQRPSRGRSWVAAVPFALAWSFAAATLSASLVPATVDQPRLEAPPPQAPQTLPPPPPPATRKRELDFDSSELISV